MVKYALVLDVCAQGPGGAEARQSRMSRMSGGHERVVFSNSEACARQVRAPAGPP